MTLFAVDNDEVEAILALTVPDHPRTNFDDAAFLDLVARAFSITETEKRGIVKGCWKLTQHQIDALFQILREEREKLVELNATWDTRLDYLAAQFLPASNHAVH